MTTLIDQHSDHVWQEIPPCVWCQDCKVRLYTGQLPSNRAPANRATCRHENTDTEAGMGFYVLCLECGAQGWWEWDEKHENEWIEWPRADQSGELRPKGRPEA